MKWAYSISILSMLMLAGCSEEEKVDTNPEHEYNIPTTENESSGAELEEMKHEEELPVEFEVPKDIQENEEI